MALLTSANDYHDCRDSIDVTIIINDSMRRKKRDEKRGEMEGGWGRE